MKVAFVSSEIAPYASTGSLADTCASLPCALQASGIAVTMFMPMYRAAIEGPYSIEDTGIRLSIPVGFHRYRADVWKTKSSSPEVYFIRRDEFFDRSQLYNLADRDYDDNFERFVFFQKAVTALIDHMKKPFDLVHCHDWQTGLLPLYLRHGMQGEGRGQREKTIFTIHNLAFQGIFNGDAYSYSNLPFSCFSVDTLEYYGNINCLKAGITTSDRVTTLSRTYAREIQTEPYGCGLHGVLSSVAGKISGIANGIDCAAWNPSNDKHLPANFDQEDLTGKRANKTDLIRRFKMHIKPEDPLLGMVSSLTAQKGIECIDDVLPWIMENTRAGFIMLGGGSDNYIELVTHWAERWPERVVIKAGYDSKLAHRIMAGSDMYLMPSKFEPGGLNQLYAMRYGTIPVVHATGGLEDTVVDATDDPARGCGFKFRDFSASEFQRAMHRAFESYANTGAWQKIQKNAMSLDFSWQKAAQEYKGLYHDLIGSRG